MPMRSILPGLFLMTPLALASTSAASVVRGPHFVEPGDAGSSRNTATDVKGSGSSGKVESLYGSLGGGGGVRDPFSGDYQDVYRINVADPNSFKVELEQISGLDSMLFLFNEWGNPIMASANTSSQNFNPILDNADGSFFTESGIYYLAITSSPSEALTQVGGDSFVSLFNLAENPFGTVGPSENAYDLKWTDAWSTPAAGNSGAYYMLLDGVASIPTPASLALLVLAAGHRSRRRR